jgi:hypothetical protein
MVDWFETATKDMKTISNTGSRLVLSFGIAKAGAGLKALDERQSHWQYCI